MLDMLLVWLTDLLFPRRNLQPGLAKGRRVVVPGAVAVDGSELCRYESWLVLELGKPLRVAPDKGAGTATALRSTLLVGAESTRNGKRLAGRPEFWRTLEGHDGASHVLIACADEHLPLVTAVLASVTAPEVGRSKHE